MLLHLKFSMAQTLKAVSMMLMLIVLSSFEVKNCISISISQCRVRFTQQSTHAD